MREAIILKETKFCKLMKINSVSPDIFSILIEHTSYLGQSCAGNSFKYGENDRGKPCLQHCLASLEYWSVGVEGKYWDDGDDDLEGWDVDRMADEV